MPQREKNTKREVRLVGGFTKTKVIFKKPGQINQEGLRKIKVLDKWTCIECRPGCSSDLF
jgi:hypothetical protein